jgi:hypothetical protein
MNKVSGELGMLIAILLVIPAKVFIREFAWLHEASAFPFHRE